MLGMHQQTDEFRRIVMQPEQNAQADIFNPGLHGTIHRFGMPGIICLRPAGMQLFVILPVIRFLKQNIGSDFGVVQAAVIFYRRCRDVYINAANGAGFVFYAVNRIYTFKNVLQRIQHGMFSRFQSQALMPHILQSDNFRLYLFLRHLLAEDVFILGVIRAIGAAVDAVVAQVQRRKQDNPVAIVSFFDFFGKRTDFRGDFRVFVQKQNCGFGMGQPFFFACLVQNKANHRGIVAVFFRISQCAVDFRRVDKALSLIRH